MDNPGVYHPHVQDSLWPFIPAIGVLVAAGLVVLFALTVIGARERPKLLPMALLAGVAAVAVGWSSAVGVSAAAADWQSQDIADREAYVSEVRTWLSQELDTDLSRGLVERMLTGETFTVRDEAITLRADRAHDQLVIERS